MYTIFSHATTSYMILGCDNQDIAHTTYAHSLMTRATNRTHCHAHSHDHAKVTARLLCSLCARLSLSSATHFHVQAPENP